MYLSVWQNSVFSNLSKLETERLEIRCKSTFAGHNSHLNSHFVRHKIEDGRYRQRAQQQAAWTRISFQNKLEDYTKNQSQKTEGIFQRQDY